MSKLNSIISWIKSKKRLESRVKAKFNSMAWWFNRINNLEK